MKFKNKNKSYNEVKYNKRELPLLTDKNIGFFYGSLSNQSFTFGHNINKNNRGYAIPFAKRFVTLEDKLLKFHQSSGQSSCWGLYTGQNIDIEFQIKPYTLNETLQDIISCPYIGFTKRNRAKSVIYNESWIDYGFTIRDGTIYIINKSTSASSIGSYLTAGNSYNIKLRYNNSKILLYINDTLISNFDDAVSYGWMTPIFISSHFGELGSAGYKIGQDILINPIVKYNMPIPLANDGLQPLIQTLVPAGTEEPIITNCLKHDWKTNEQEGNELIDIITNSGNNLTLSPNNLPSYVMNAFMYNTLNKPLLIQLKADTSNIPNLNTYINNDIINSSLVGRIINSSNITRMVFFVRQQIETDAKNTYLYVSNQDMYLYNFSNPRIVSEESYYTSSTNFTYDTFFEGEDYEGTVITEINHSNDPSYFYQRFVIDSSLYPYGYIPDSDYQEIFDGYQDVWDTFNDDPTLENWEIVKNWGEEGGTVTSNINSWNIARRNFVYGYYTLASYTGITLNEDGIVSLLILPDRIILLKNDQRVISYTNSDNINFILQSNLLSIANNIEFLPFTDVSLLDFDKNTNYYNSSYFTFDNYIITKTSSETHQYKLINNKPMRMNYVSFIINTTDQIIISFSDYASTPTDYDGYNLNSTDRGLNFGFQNGNIYRYVGTSTSATNIVTDNSVGIGSRIDIIVWLANVSSNYFLQAQLFTNGTVQHTFTSTSSSTYTVTAADGFMSGLSLGVIGNSISYYSNKVITYNKSSIENNIIEIVKNYSQGGIALDSIYIEGSPKINGFLNDGTSGTDFSIVKENKWYRTSADSWSAYAILQPNFLSTQTSTAPTDHIILTNVKTLEYWITLNSVNAIGMLGILSSSTYINRSSFSYAINAASGGVLQDKAGNNFVLTWQAGDFLGIRMSRNGENFDVVYTLDRNGERQTASAGTYSSTDLYLGIASYPSTGYVLNPQYKVEFV